MARLDELSLAACRQSALIDRLYERLYLCPGRAGGCDGDCAACQKTRQNDPNADPAERPLDDDLDAAADVLGYPIGDPPGIAVIRDYQSGELKCDRCRDPRGFVPHDGNLKYCDECSRAGSEIATATENHPIAAGWDACAMRYPEQAHSYGVLLTLTVNYAGQRFWINRTHAANLGRALLELANQAACAEAADDDTPF